MKFNDVVTMYLTEKKCMGLSEASIYSYGLSLKYFQEYTKIKDIEQLNKPIVMLFLSKIDDKSVETKNHYLRDVRSFSYWCMEENLIDRFKIRLTKGQSNKIKFYTDSELEKLLVPASPKDRTDYRTYAMICFIMATGARASSVCYLRQDDVDFVNSTVTLSKLKNKKTATIPMSPTLRRILSKYISYNKSTDLVFNCSVNALQIAFKRYCDDRQVICRGVHALRHSYARTFIKNGGSAFALQKILTHSDIGTTQRYVRLFTEDLRTEVYGKDPLASLYGK